MTAAACAILSAVEDGQLSTVVALLSSSGTRVNVINKHGESSLHIAAGYGRLDIVTTLLDSGANLNLTDKQGDSPLYWAARHGHLEVVQHLVEQGASVNNKDMAGETAVHVSARYGYPLVLSYLCQAGASVDARDKEGDTPLLCACWHGYLSVVEVLLKAGASLSAANHELESPLLVAALRGYYDIVKVLCANGAAVDQLDKDGRSALHYSAKRNHSNIVQCLCKSGATVNIQDSNGDSALHEVCREGQMDCLEALINSNCSVNLQNKNGATPLHLAAKYGHTELVRALCLQGADVHLVTEQGYHADQVAANSNRDNLASLLHQLGTVGALEWYRQQLSLCKQSETVKLLLLGDSAVGKTALVESLKRGFLRSLFRPQVTPPTMGVVIESHTLPLAGPFSVWDFSGRLEYHILTECFVTAVNSVILVVFSLPQSLSSQLSSLRYWLGVLKSVLCPVHCPHVLLVGVGPTDRDFNELYSALTHEWGSWMSVELHTVDCRVAQSVRMFRRRLAVLRQEVTKAQPFTAPITHAVLDHLTSWRQTDYPVISLDDFQNKTRLINPLVTMERSKVIARTLHNMGEVVCLDDVIVLDPNWLSTKVLTPLLSTPHTVPTSDIDTVTNLCERLSLCVPLDNASPLFPCLIRTPTPDNVWDSDPSFTRYAGVRLQCKTVNDLFTEGLFCQLQLNVYQLLSSVCDLSLWTHGLKVVEHDVEALLVMNAQNTLQLLVRGAMDASQPCYSLQSKLYTVIIDTIKTTNPGVHYQTGVISCKQLLEHCQQPSTYTVMDLYQAQTTGSHLSHPTLSHCTERVCDLLWCGASNVESALVRDLSPLVVDQLCGLLDPPDAMGRDWCLLAVRLGLIDSLPSIHCTDRPTASVLEGWSGTVSCLVKVLGDLGRDDAAKVLIEGTSPFNNYTMDC